jgi:hypothetical protein
MERGGCLDGVELTLLVRWILIVGTSGCVVPPSLIFVGPLCQVVTLVSGNRLLELDILRMEALIFLLETLGHGLKSDVTFDLALFVELNACLKLSKLRLLALSEGALRDSSGYTKLARHASKVPTEVPYLFWTRRPLISGT